MDYTSIFPEINAVKLAILGVFALLINIFSVLLAYSWFSRFQKPDSKEYRKWRDDFGGGKGSIGEYNSWKKQNDSYSNRRPYRNRSYRNNYRRRGRW